MVTPGRQGRWLTSEDAILLRVVESQESIGLPRNWNAVASNIPGRSNKDCRKRWLKLIGHTKKGEWNQTEDEQLRQAVSEFGFRWVDIAKKMQTRSANQCASRWQNYLDPSLNRSEWTTSEDQRLLEAFEKYGSNWKTIQVMELKDRSLQDLRNRYRCISKAKTKRRSLTQHATPVKIEANHDLKKCASASPVSSSEDAFEPMEFGFGKEFDLYSAPLSLQTTPSHSVSGDSLFSSDFGMDRSATETQVSDFSWLQDEIGSDRGFPYMNYQQLSGESLDQFAFKNNHAGHRKSHKVVSSVITLDGIDIPTLDSIVDVLKASSARYNVVIHNNSNHYL